MSGRVLLRYCGPRRRPTTTATSMRPRMWKPDAVGSGSLLRAGSPATPTAELQDLTSTSGLPTHRTRCSARIRLPASSLRSRRSPNASTRCGPCTGTSTPLTSPDPQDPRVVQQRLLKRLAFTQAVLDNLPQVLELLTGASSTDEALINVAELLNVDETDVMVGLAHFDLLTLTQPATE